MAPLAEKQIGDCMKRKVIKKLTMLSLVSMFTICAAVASANAQLSIPVRAKIPFDFNVGDQKLPAGEYTFGRLSGSSVGSVMSGIRADEMRRSFQAGFLASVREPQG